MSRTSFLLVLILMKVWACCKDTNFFSLNDDTLSFDQIDPNLSDNLFANEADFNINDQYLVNDELFNNEGYLPTEPFSDNFLAANDEPNCSSFSSLSRRIRARLDSCSTTPQKYLVVKTAEDVQKYWCSETVALGFANIPVCSLLSDALGVIPSEQSPWPEIDISSIPEGFLTLTYCRICKFVHIYGICASKKSLKFWTG